MDINEIQRQVGNMVDDAYRAGFEAALEALRSWRDTLDPEYDETGYIEGINDSIITLEQGQ